MILLKSILWSGSERSAERGNWRQTIAEVEALQRIEADLQALLPAFFDVAQKSVRLSLTVRGELIMQVESALLRQRMVLWLGSAEGRDWLATLPVRYAPARMRCQVQPKRRQPLGNRRRTSPKQPPAGVADDFRRMARGSDAPLAAVLLRLAARADQAKAG